MEKVDMKKVIYQTKIVGTLVTVAGAMLMTLYKGRVVEMVWSKNVHPHQSNESNTSGTTDKDWFTGCILLIIATFAWASFFILQVTLAYIYRPRLGLCLLYHFVLLAIRVLNRVKLQLMEKISKK